MSLSQTLIHGWTELRLDFPSALRLDESDAMGINTLAQRADRLLAIPASDDSDVALHVLISRPPRTPLGTGTRMP